MLNERILWLLIFAAVCTTAWLLMRVWQQRKLAALQQQDAPSPADGFGVTGAALLYFSTADCGQCRFQQEPILQRLSATVDSTAFTIIPLDAVERMDLARHYGIMTVPSTVLLDGSRRPVAINHGVTPLHKLQEQLTLVV